MIVLGYNGFSDVDRFAVGWSFTNDCRQRSRRVDRCRRAHGQRVLGRSVAYLGPEHDRAFAAYTPPKAPATHAVVVHPKWRKPSMLK
jgi:hypothetical protein